MMKSKKDLGKIENENKKILEKLSVKAQQQYLDSRDIEYKSLVEKSDERNRIILNGSKTSELLNYSIAEV